MTNLEQLQDTYERFGREDAMYAVLTDKERRNNRWVPAEFFETGLREIAGVLAYLDALGVVCARGRALDFGAGVGRLSQALGDHFDHVVGVDIAESMLNEARRHNRHGDRVEYRHNTRDDLSQFPSATFDFIYSNITLQHIPPQAVERYVAEFMRLLRPGGVAVFQIPSGPLIRPGSLRALLYQLQRHHLRRLWKRIRGEPPYEIHYLARERVEALVRNGGCDLRDVVDVSSGGGKGRNFRYCAVRSA